MPAFITNPPAIAGGGAGAWTLIETLSPSAVTTITTTIKLEDYSEILIDGFLLGSAADSFFVRINGNTGAVYTYTAINAAETIIIDVNQTVGCFCNSLSNVVRTYFRTIMPVAVGANSLSLFTHGGFPNSAITLMGLYAGSANEKVDNLTFRTGSAGTFTGTIKVFAR